MKIRFHQRASADVRQAVASLRAEGAGTFAERLLSAVDLAVRQIRRSPSSGSPRFGRLLGIPELRCVVLQQVPWTLFYVVTSTEVRVVRVLHQRSDILKTLR